MRSAGRGPAVAAVLLAAAAPAAAHGTIEGVAPFYGGLLHPLLVPAHPLLLLALGLVLAQGGRAAAPRALGLWVLGLALGLVARARWAAPEAVALAPLALAAGIGLLVAAAAPPRGPLAAALAGLAGLALGLDSDPAGSWPALAGTGLGASGVLLLVAGGLVDRRAAWLAIGIRVAGSWIAAAALMVLALALRS